MAPVLLSAIRMGGGAYTGSVDYAHGAMLFYTRGDPNVRHSLAVFESALRGVAEGRLVDQVSLCASALSPECDRAWTRRNFLRSQSSIDPCRPQTCTWTRGFTASA